MNKKYNNKKIHLLFFIFIILSTAFLSVGYASLDSIVLNIDGEVTALPQSDIYITDITYKTNIDADIENSTIQQYYQTLMQSSIVLGNTTNSSITYSVTVYNSSDMAYFFNEVEYSDAFYDNPNIVFELDGLQKWDSIESKQSRTFSITFKYANNTIPDSKVLNSYLNFKFMVGSLDDTNILTNKTDYIIYNAKTDKAQFEVANNNEFAVDINLKIGDSDIKTLSLNPSQTAQIDVDFSSRLNTLQPYEVYPVMIEQTAPYTVSKQTSITAQIIPTMTNYDLGLNTAGTEQKPYAIHKIEDLVRFAQNVNAGTTFSNKYIKLLNDVDFKKASDYYQSNDTSFDNLNNTEDSNEILNEMTTGTGFIMIGNSDTNCFQGNFNGDNHTIGNLLINSSDTAYPHGLFRALRNATIENTSVSGNATFPTDGSAFVGNIYETTKFSNCHTSVAILNKVADVSIGGLVGTIQSGSTVTVDKCSNTGTVTMQQSGGMGGLVGFAINATVTITNSYNAGNLTATLVGATQTSFAGGLVTKDSSGGANITIKNSYNSGDISMTNNGSGGTVAGGLVGISAGTLQIDSCYNKGALKASTGVGGILGKHGKPWGGAPNGKTTIANSYTYGTISGNVNKGGIIGDNTGTAYDISKAYYLQTTASNNIGNASGNASCAKTEADMKASAFVTLLGNQFMADTTPFKNSGYPILKTIEY